MAEKFLTVYAVLDEASQQTLLSCRRVLEAAGIAGTQTNDIPFHISLGSYPVDSADVLPSRIRDVCAQTAPFPLHLAALGDFGNRVLFARPEDSDGIMRLRGVFDNDYPNAFPYCPHCTILQDTQANVISAGKLLESCFKPFTATVVGIELGEFFPTRRLLYAPFAKPPLSAR